MCSANTGSYFCLEVFKCHSKKNGSYLPPCIIYLDWISRVKASSSPSWHAWISPLSTQALPSSAVFLNLKLGHECRSTSLVYDHVYCFLEYHFKWWDFEEPAFLVAFMLKDWSLYWKIGGKNDLAPQKTKNIKELSKLFSFKSKSVHCINTSGTNLLQFLTNQEFLSSCNSFQYSCK